MKLEIEKLFSAYTHWLEKETSFVKIGEYYEITVPFLNNENDFLQIYVQIRKDNVFFKDDGCILRNSFFVIVFWQQKKGLSLRIVRRKTLNKFRYRILHGCVD